MDIEFAATENFALEHHVLRKKHTFCDEDGQLNHWPTFQAVLRDNRKRNSNIVCRLTYFGEGGEFLGFDDSQLWPSSKQEVLHLSMTVSIPDSTQRAELSVTESKSDKQDEWMGLLAVGVLVGLAVMLLAIVRS